MVFSSIFFLLFFLPCLLIIYYLIRKEYKNYVLIFFSLLFYFWGESYFLIFFLLSVGFNYIIGLMLENSRSRSVLWFGIAVNLFFIGYYKYYNFFLDISNTAFRTDFHLKKIHLPIGISFFTFQAVSYLIDVYRNDVSAQRKFSGFLLYISFFPQLIAGPIVRYIDIQKNLFFRTVNWEDLDVGLKRFVIGLSKKVLIANQMALASDRIFAVPIDEMNTALAWLGIVSYSFQIYYDFSGYSDMAIGLGRVFGFHFNENFNSPYAASSVQDFWRRWHISLSTWFRDYLYIPLGGNRVSQKRLIINLLIVFFSLVSGMEQVSISSSGDLYTVFS